MSVHPSVRMEGIFMKFDIGVFFLNLSRKFMFNYNLAGKKVLFLKADIRF